MLRDNPAASRFELQIGEDVAFADYTMDGDVITFTHTKVPPHLEGSGNGTKLALFALDSARARGLKVVPACPFIRHVVDENPSYADLLSLS